MPDTVLKSNGYVCLVPSGDGVKSHGSPGNLKRLHARALTRSVSYCTPAKRLTRSQSDMEKSRSLKDVVRTCRAVRV
eukprot:6491824-Amphidinium_carterae.1